MLVRLQLETSGGPQAELQVYRTVEAAGLQIQALRNRNESMKLDFTMAGRNDMQLKRLFFQGKEALAGRNGRQVNICFSRQGKITTTEDAHMEMNKNAQSGYRRVSDHLWR